MSPVSTLVLTITLRASALSDSWVQFAHKGKLLATTPAPINRLNLFTVEHSIDAPQYDLTLFAAHFVGKINCMAQKLTDHAANIGIIWRNRLLEIRKIFRLLIERPKKSGEVLFAARGIKHE